MSVLFSRAIRAACAYTSLLTTVLPSGLSVNTPAQIRHRITLRDFGTLRSVAYLKMSPDGQSVAYVVNGEIWLVATSGKTPPHVLVKGTCPVWSADNKYLAYLSYRSGTLQLWTIEVHTHNAKQLTYIRSGIDPNPWALHIINVSEPVSHSWSPDGTKLVFSSQVVADANNKLTTSDSGGISGSYGGTTPLILTSHTPPNWTLSGVFSHWDLPDWATWGKKDNSGLRQPPRTPLVKATQLFVFDVRTKKLEQLTTDNRMYFDPDWSPNGREIVCVSSEGRALTPANDEPTNIYVIDIQTHRKTALTNDLSDKWLPHWSPDGRQIAYWSGIARGRHCVAIISRDPDSGVHNPFLTADLDVFGGWFEWSADGKAMAVNYTDVESASIGIAWIDGLTGQFEKVTTDQPSVALYMTASRSGALAWQQSDGSSNGVIRILPPHATSSRVLVDLNPQINTWQLGSQEVVRWENRHGDKRTGILIKPVGYQEGRLYPLIVDGYPQRPSGFFGNPMIGNQYWATRGYAVFFPNPRVPYFWVSYSRIEDENRARGPDGWDVAVDDVMSGLDELIRRGVVDPQRIGIYGFSNGGGVADYLVTRTNRFKCAVSVAGAMADWVRPMLLDGDFEQLTALAGGATIWEDPQAYIRLSPVFHLNKVTTPMLLADGDRDQDFLLNTIEMYNGLRHSGADVTLLRYPNQEHGFTGNALKDFWQRENEFFAKYLQPDLAVYSRNPSP